MRDTYDATEVATAILPYKVGAHECRLERISVKEDNQEEIRFSWWENGNIVPCRRAFENVEIWTEAGGARWW